MYTIHDFRTKKALKEAVAAANEAVANGGDPEIRERIRIYQPGGFFPDPDFNSVRTHCVEGPHYPKPHSWYATCETDQLGYIVKVK